MRKLISSALRLWRVRACVCLCLCVCLVCVLGGEGEDQGRAPGGMSGLTDSLPSGPGRSPEDPNERRCLSHESSGTTRANAVLLTDQPGEDQVVEGAVVVLVTLLRNVRPASKPWSNRSPPSPLSARFAAAGAEQQQPQPRQPQPQPQQGVAFEIMHHYHYQPQPHRHW